MESKNVYGVYIIFKRMELGRTFRVSMQKYPTQDPTYPILRIRRAASRITERELTKGGVSFRMRLDCQTDSLDHSSSRRKRENFSYCGARRF